jgi:hypothetical protein
MRTQVGTLVVLLASASVLLADEPPSWAEFDVASSNKKFVGKVTVKDKNGKKFPYEWSYSLSVYAKDEAKPLWSASYGYDGYPGGLLSDDGNTFAYVNFWALRQSCGERHR